HREAGEAVALAEDHPAAVRKAQLPAKAPGRFDPPAEKGLVDDLVLVPGENADGDFAVGVKIAPRHKGAAAVDDIHNAAHGADVVIPVDFVVVDPKAAPAKVNFLAPPEAYRSIFHRVYFASR